jgi:hypothetical protein
MEGGGGGGSRVRLKEDLRGAWTGLQMVNIQIVLLPENLHTCFEPSVQAWILYKAPQWNARYPNSYPERIKLKMH